VLEETQKLTGQVKLSELIKDILPDSIYIRLDSVHTIPFVKEEILYDTILRTIRLIKSFQKKDSIKWKEAKLVFGEMAFTSVHGDSTKQTPATITPISPEETAVLIIESKSAKAYTIIEVLNDKFEVIASQPHAKITTFKNLPANAIMLRAVSDSNQNGKWDPGNPNLKTLPENVTFYLNEQKKKQIPLRANWEVNTKWNL
jgi:hypothetical protein